MLGKATKIIKLNEKEHLYEFKLSMIQGQLSLRAQNKRTGYTLVSEKPVKESPPKPVIRQILHECSIIEVG